VGSAGIAARVIVVESIMDGLEIPVTYVSKQRAVPAPAKSVRVRYSSRYSSFRNHVLAAEAFFWKLKVWTVFSLWTGASRRYDTYSPVLVAASRRWVSPSLFLPPNSGILSTCRERVCVAPFSSVCLISPSHDTSTFYY